MILVALGGYTWWFQHETGLERTLGQISSEVAGHEVAVECPSFWRYVFADTSPYHGTVEWGSDVAKLSHNTCERLERVVGHGFSTEPELEFAVHVVTHEAGHLRGITDEADTECFAVHHDAYVAKRFGATREEAVAFAARMYKRNRSGITTEYEIRDDCLKRRDLGAAP